MSQTAVTAYDIVPAPTVADIHPDVQTMAFEIADDAARGMIETACKRGRSGEHDWYDLSTSDLNHWYYVDQAVAYIVARGDAAPYRMVRCQAFPRLVRFEERP